MIFTKMKGLLVAAASLVAFSSAQAQFEGSVSQYPTKGYEGNMVSFSMAEVATALGADATSLTKAVNDYISAETPDPVLFSAVSANGTETPWSAAVEAANHGFWMDAEGVPVGHGNNSAWFVSPGVEGAENPADVNGDGVVDVADISAVITIMAEGTNSANGDVNSDGQVDVADISAIISSMAGGSDNADAKLTFNIGQMPNVCQGGENYSVTVKLTLNGQTATFKLGLTVMEKPTYNVPQPTLIESQLTIVGEQEKVVEQYPRGGYDSDEVTVELPDLATMLGIPDLGVMTDQIDAVLYTTWYNDGDIEEGGGMKKDSLTNAPTGEGHGFWYRAVQNADGEEDGEVSASGWGNIDKFFLNNFTYTADGNTLTCYLGQYPGVCKDNETWFAYIYIIYGEKAYRIKYTLKLLEKEQGSGLSNYTKVGEATVTVEQEPREDYSTNAVHPDVDAIAAALGCEVSAIGMIAFDDKDNEAPSTANNGGFWFSDAGTVVAWGNGAMFIEPATSGDYSTLNVGQHRDRKYQVGEEGEASVYFTNGTNYYAYTVKLKIVEPKKEEHNFESVATRAAQIQTLPSATSYPIDATYSIAIEDIEALIGTSDPVLYGLNIDSVAAIKGEYSTAYSCDPKPGFWLNKDGRVSVWGDANACVGICYADGNFTFFQYPNRNSIGDNFKSTLFLVNEETEKMITINFTVSFVEKLTPVETVGTENITLPLSTNEERVKFDVQKACDALNITIDDLLNPNNYYLRGLSIDGTYDEAQTAENGLCFAMDGGYDGYGNIYFVLELDGDDLVIVIGCSEQVADDFSVDGQFCIEVFDQRYVYNVKFVSPAIYEASK